MGTDESIALTKVRLDKWLWAARFFKTRSQAVEAINGGHVKFRGDRTKPGQAVKLDQAIEIAKDGIVWEVLVRGLSEKRGKGADAAKLYEETKEGRERRERQLEALRAAREAAPYLAGRPTKRDRRALDRFQGGSDE